MKNVAAINKLDLLEQVTLPMGNIAWALETLLNQELPLNSDGMKQGLRSIQENAEAIHQFLLDIDENPTSVVGRRTPQVLRQFVAEKRRAAFSLSIAGS